MTYKDRQPGQGSCSRTSGTVSTKSLDPDVCQCCCSATQNCSKHPLAIPRQQQPVSVEATSMTCIAGIRAKPSGAGARCSTGCRSLVAGPSRAPGFSAGSLPCATVSGLAAAVCCTDTGQGGEGAEAASSPGQHSSCKLCWGTRSCHQATIGCRQCECCRCSTGKRLAEGAPLCSV